MDVCWIAGRPMSPSVRAWRRWHVALVAACVLGCGALLTPETVDAPPQYLVVQPSAARIIGNAGILGRPLLLAPQPRTTIRAASPNDNSFADEQPLRSVHPPATAEVTSETAGLVPLAALVALFAGAVAAHSKPQSTVTMLAVAPEDPEASVVKLQSTAQDTTVGAEAVAEKPRSKAALLHPLAFTAFIAQAYFSSSPLPGLLPRPIWLWIHCVGAMLFGGLIFSSTIYEAMVILQGNPHVRRWWFERVPLVDSRYLMPFLGVVTISGVCLAQIRYDSLRASPGYVPLSLELLVLFGIVWITLDRSTQREAKDQAVADYERWEQGTWKEEGLPDILKKRLAINAVSLPMVVFVYWIMVAKPDFQISSLFS